MVRNETIRRSYVLGMKTIITDEAVPFYFDDEDDYNHRPTFSKSLQAAKKWANDNSGNVATMPNIAQLRTTDLRAFNFDFDTTTGHYHYNGKFIIYHGLNQPLLGKIDLTRYGKGETTLKPRDGGYFGDPSFSKCLIGNPTSEQFIDLENRCISFDELMKSGSPKEHGWGVLLDRKQSGINYNYDNECIQIEVLKKAPRIIASLGPENAEKYLDTFARFFNKEEVGFRGFTMSDCTAHLVRADRYCDLFSGVTFYVYGYSPFRQINCFVGIRKIDINKAPEIKKRIGFKNPSLRDMLQAISDFTPPAAKREVRDRLKRILSIPPK
jgi:hypothetical protein